MMSGPAQDPEANQNLQRTIQIRTAEAERFHDWIYQNGTAQPDYIPANDTEIPAWNNTFSLMDVRDNAAVQPLVDELQSPRENAVYFRNITGFLKGTWEPFNATLSHRHLDLETSNMTESDLAAYNKTKPINQRGAFPWYTNATKNTIDINIKETVIAEYDNKIQFVRGSAEFKSDLLSVEVDIDGVQ